jgi:hypothetical protein
MLKREYFVFASSMFGVDQSEHAQYFGTGSC